MGYPIFELGSMYNAFVGFSEVDHETILRFQGYDFETAKRFWHDTLAAYLETASEAKIREVEDKARVVGYTRLIRRALRRGEQATEKGRTEIALWTKELLALLETVDTLTFSRDSLEIDAAPENLADVQAFIEERIGDCSPKALMQLGLVAEEVFINIASYAYAPNTGKATVRIVRDSDAATLVFTDRGIPYDPLKRDDPDVTLSAEARRVGGLGIYLTKKLTDDVQYEYRDGQNVLTLTKRL